MPTRLAVLLQRRKSAAAGLFHRHMTASASAGSRPAVKRAANRFARWEFFGIIQASYIKSLTISREPAETVNGQAGILRQWAGETRPSAVMFALRYGKICDSAHLLHVSCGKRRDIDHDH